MDMNRFFNDQNLERLPSLASIATTEAERKILLGLLAEERVKFIELPEGQNDCSDHGLALSALRFCGVHPLTAVGTNLLLRRRDDIGWHRDPLQEG
jgi:hypothetical protein